MDELTALSEIWAAMMSCDENATEADERESHISLCTVKDLLECTDIGATTFARYRVKLDRSGLKHMSLKAFPPFAYAWECICITGFLFTRRWSEECYVSFRILEEGGYVMNTALMSIAQAQEDMLTMFGNDLARRKLRGKFHLEILFVDSQRIGDKDLCDKYATNINARLGDFSDTSCLKEKVKKAEKWLNMARKKKAKQITCNEVARNVVDNSAEPRYFADVAASLAHSCYRFPIEGKVHHLILQKWLVRLPDSVMKSGRDRASLYATVAYKTFKKHYKEYLTNNTHTMFEFFTEDAKRIVTKLCQYTQNGLEVISNRLREYDSETFGSMFNFTVYIVDVPGFATPKGAQSRLNFVRKHFEKVSDICDNAVLQYDKLAEEEAMESDNRVKGVNLEECTELFEKNCDCDKFHLSSYCSIRLLRDKKSLISSITFLSMHSWSISLSDLCLSLFEDATVAKLYYMIANRICCYNYEKPTAGTNILCEMMVGENMYSTRLMHHSDAGQESLKKEMFQPEEGKDVKLTKEITVTVYVVDILSFDTNEKAHQFLYKMRMENNKSDTILAETIVPVENEANTSLETMDDFEIGYFDCETPQPIVNHNKIEGMFITFEEDRKITKNLENSYFKDESKLAVKASTELLQLHSGYNILSLKNPLSTSKGRISVFLVEQDSQFHSDVLDNALFMADILINIVKNKEITEWSGRRIKITLKLYERGIPIYVQLRKEDLVNANNLKEKLVRKGVMDMGKQFHLEVQYRVI